MTYLILHSEFALALRHATKGVRVAEHVVQCNFGGDREFIFTNLAVDDITPTSVETADNSTCRRHVRHY